MHNCPCKYPKQIYSMCCSLCITHTYSMCDEAQSSFQEWTPAALPRCAIQPLYTIQNTSAWCVFNLPKFSHSTSLLNTFRLACLQNRNRTSTHLHYKKYRTLYCTTTLFGLLKVQGKHVSSIFSFLVPRWWNEFSIDVHTTESLSWHTD